MNGALNEEARYGASDGRRTFPPQGAAPLLRVNVFGGFEMLLDGGPVDYSALKQRRLKILLCILVLNHGQELYSDYLAESLWPESPASKQRNCFYNLWYLLVHAVVPDGGDRSAYFSREQYSCRLLDAHVSSDVEDAERACEDLTSPGLDPLHAVDAYRRLQRAYRGDLLPGEDRNPIIVRAREEWRERVSESLYVAAKTMQRLGEARTALWLVRAACRVDETREDLARLRMRLLIDLGRPSAALQVYEEMSRYLMDEVGVRPSRQSSELIREVVCAEPVELRIPIPGNRGGRRGGRARGQGARALPRRSGIPS